MITRTEKKVSEFDMPHKICPAVDQEKPLETKLQGAKTSDTVD